MNPDYQEQYGAMHSSRLQVLAQMQAALALQNQQSRSQYSTTGPQSGGLGLSGASVGRFPPTMERTSLHQSMLLGEEARFRSTGQTQIGMIGRSTAELRETPFSDFGLQARLTPQIPSLMSAQPSSPSPRKRMKLSVGSWNDSWNDLKLHPRRIGGSQYQSVHAPEKKIDPKSNSFPLPSLRSTSIRREEASLISYRIAWDNMSQLSRNIEYIKSPERRELVREAFGKALQFNKIQLYKFSQKGSAKK
jgi:hypothetical protein